jgi:hypothetical protein
MDRIESETGYIVAIEGRLRDGTRFPAMDALYRGGDVVDWNEADRASADYCIGMPYGRVWVFPVIHGSVRAPSEIAAWLSRMTTRYYFVERIWS